MKPVIYQIFVRLFGNKKEGVEIYGTINENGCGKFSDINEPALNSLKEMGITHIWYTGIIEHAVATDYSKFGIDNDFPEIVKGRAGSPYAIKDYYDVDPDLANNVPGRMQEFDELVERTHKAGIRVIIDFVPNHVARCYKSDANSFPGIYDFGVNDNTANEFSAENDFYYLPCEELKLPEELYKRSAIIEYRKVPEKYREFPARATGNDCFRANPGSDDWYETVKLNYGVDYFNGNQKHFCKIPPLWEKMKSVILYWAGKNVDGFRADMAEMVPLEFWKWLIPAVKKQYPDLLFIAEIYQPHLYKDFIETGGFDYLYDKIDFYDTTRSIIEGKADTRSITHCWQRVGDLEKYMLRFLENHDEQRVASRFFAGDPWKALPGMVLAATMNSGPLMVYSGQEVGEPADGSSGFSSDDGRTTIFDYWNVPNHQRWMNQGKFDGKALSHDMTELRNNYTGIIRLCSQYKLFATRGFYDLMWVNEKLFEQSSARIYAYLRYDGSDIALIVLNFSDNFFAGARLFIPDDAFKALQVTGRLKVARRIAFPASDNIAMAEIDESSGNFIFDIPQYTALVFFLRQQ